MRHFPGGAGEKYAGSIGNNGTLVLVYETAGQITDGRVDVELVEYLTRWYENNLLTFCS